MPLTAGSRLGVYDVIAPIGAGGMGEVYRAHDSRLGRHVAIKVLPDALASDPERIARFEREARALAALNHPNIAIIHGIEEVAAARPGHAPVKALILELVEGETLADRLTRGPLALDEALAVAGQIADALEAAHEKGIVHRDLKPSNVKITRGGLVKVLDFGIAKIEAAVSDDLPTAAVGATGVGMILGTPNYMAPEQAQGKTVDKRVDVWAFGVLLFEMLAGARPFSNVARPDAIQEPDWDRIPQKVRAALRRCLERDPQRRLRDIGDFRFLLDQPSTSDSTASHTRRSRALVAASVVVAAVALVFAAWIAFRSSPAMSPEPVRLTTMLPDGVAVTRGAGFASSVAISPDGRTIVVAGTGQDGQQLYRRPLNGLEAAPLAGTERGSGPFFSADGAWIGFFADGRLKRIPAAGGPAVDITAIPGFLAGASWGPDDAILYASGPGSPLYVVNARGGTAETVPGVASVLHPVALPDGRTVLYESGGWVHALDRSSGRHARIVQGASPDYAMGHVILSRGTTLLAAPIDLARQEVTGPAVPVAEGVARESVGLGIVHYALSSSGNLAYVPAASAYELAVVEPDGRQHLVATEQQRFENPQWSPDGESIAVAVSRRENERQEVWVYDAGSVGAATRLTFDGGRAPIWAPDGERVIYSHLGPRGGIYARRADGTGDATPLIALDAFHWLVGSTPDQRALAYGQMEGADSSIMALIDGTPRRVVGPASTWGGRLSRDGRLLVFYLLESGNFEVYATPFPGGGARWLIAEGTDPTWSPDGSEVYYRSGARLMAAKVDRTAGIRVLSHRVVVEPFLPPQYDDYDIHPDARTIVMVRPAGGLQGREVTVAVNWFTELRRLIASS